MERDGYFGDCHLERLNMLLDLLLRWIHIFGAIMLVGSTIYMRCVHVPAKLLSDDELSDAYNEAQRKFWSRMVMIASGQLLISGIINVVLIVQRYDIDKSEFPGNAYHAILGVKFLLAMVVFFLAAAISGRKALAKKVQQKEKMWLTVNMVLAIIVVCMAGVMRLTPREKKSSEPATSSRAVEQSGVEYGWSTFDERSREIS